MKKLLCLILLSAAPLGAQTNYKKDFLEKYTYIISKKEKKEFEKLQTDTERDAYISSFWSIRDTDPNTPENEYKSTIDQRISDVENDIALQMIDLQPVFFHESVKGHMDRVYILHGKPEYMEKIYGRTFVDLMVWIYGDGYGRELFRFLFYQKYGGPFILYRYQGESLLEWGIAEISVVRPITEEDYQIRMQEILEELRLLLAWPFIRALLEFSSIGNLQLDEALAPPTPAAILASQAGFSIRGQPPVLLNKTIIYGRYNSWFPAQLIKAPNWAVNIAKDDLDWVENSEDVVCELRVFVLIQNADTKLYVLLIQKMLKLSTKKDTLGTASILQIKFPDIDKLPPGRYMLNMYMRNMATNQYTSWMEEFTK